MKELLVDTSIAVALVVADHENHAAANATVGRAKLGLAGHAAFETFSVLTRLPGASRRSAQAIQRVLNVNFPVTVFVSARRQSDLLIELATLGVSGGSVYDALVGAAAVEAKMPLVSADRRALETYRALGVDVELVG